MRIGLVVPHMFMHEEIIHEVIFAPGSLALTLAQGLEERGNEVYFFSPQQNSGLFRAINADLTNFEWELWQRGYGYMELFKKHPLLFITLARQVQSELIAKAFTMANTNKLDVIHVYTNEEELALTFAELCAKPVVFTHHEPFNYLAKYRVSFPRFKHLNWISISLSQRKSMPEDTNFIANIYHGIAENRFKPVLSPQGDYLAYFGRIIKPKGVHLAIQAARKAGVQLRIAGKHYVDTGNDNYWKEWIEPEIDGDRVEYIGFLKTDEEKQEFLGNAQALLVPSTWEEPFGMVMLESLACATPIIGLNSGSIPEIITDQVNGFIVEKVLSEGVLDENLTIAKVANSISRAESLCRDQCHQIFQDRFTAERMCAEHERMYNKIIG